MSQNKQGTITPEVEVLPRNTTLNSQQATSSDLIQSTNNTIDNNHSNNTASNDLSLPHLRINLFDDLLSIYNTLASTQKKIDREMRFDNSGTIVRSLYRGAKHTTKLFTGHYLEFSELMQHQIANIGEATDLTYEAASHFNHAHVECKQIIFYKYERLKEHNALAKTASSNLEKKERTLTSKTRWISMTRKGSNKFITLHYQISNLEDEIEILKSRMGIANSDVDSTLKNISFAEELNQYLKQTKAFFEKLTSKNNRMHEFLSETFPLLESLRSTGRIASALVNKNRNIAGIIYESRDYAIQQLKHNGLIEKVNTSYSTLTNNYSELASESQNRYATALGTGSRNRPSNNSRLLLPFERDMR